jgi:hypothetical protein
MKDKTLHYAFISYYCLKTQHKTGVRQYSTLVVYFLCRRVAKDLEDRRSHYEPSVGAVPDEAEHAFKLEEHDFVPHFQRVSVSGEDTSGVSSDVLCSFRNLAE